MGTALASDTGHVSPARRELDFDALVERHQSMVFSIALHFLQDRPSAEELAQDVFLQLYRHLDRLESAEHVTFWLRRVTAHRCIDRGRRRSRTTVSLETIAEPAVSSPQADPLLARRLRAVMGELPRRARIAVILRYQEDLTPEEIAQLLNRPLATVKSQLQRALKALRAKVLHVVGDRRP